MAVLCFSSSIGTLKKSQGKDELVKADRTTGNVYKTYNQLRPGNLNYAEFIDTYAPCMVGEAAWNVGGGNVLETITLEQFHCLLSPSDEAFLVAAFGNYHNRWNAEYENSVKQVCLVKLCLLSRQITVFSPASLMQLEDGSNAELVVRSL